MPAAQRTVHQSRVPGLSRVGKSLLTIAVTAFLGFIAGWTEFYFSVIFLSDPKQFTLAVALNGMVGQFATTTPWSMFSAFAIMFALPVSIVYLFLQKYIIGGLAIGGVKG